MSKILNSKILSKELHDYQIRLMKGGVADFAGIGDYIAKESVNYDGENGLIRLVGSMGGQACLQFHYYWSYRDQVHEYQAQNNVSSVAFQEVNWDGCVIRYPEMEDQLLPMPQDKPIVCRYRNKVVDWFCNFADKYKEKGYNLVIKDDDGYCDKNIYINTAHLRLIAKKYEWATITQYSPEVQPVHICEIDDNGNRIDKGIGYWKREFWMFLERGDNINDNTDLILISLEKQWDEKPNSENP